MHHLRRLSGRRALLVLGCAVLVAGCASSPGRAGGGASPGATQTAENQGGNRILTAPVPNIPGPKRTIAVGVIDAIGPVSGPFGRGAVGGSVAAMLTTALIESGRFIVIERGALDQVLTEQELAASGVAQGTAAPKPGRIIPAQYLVVGSVSEFSTGDEGGSVGIGGTGGGGFLGALTLSERSGRVGFDLRVVNTRTTAIEDGFTVREELSSTGLGATAGYSGIVLGGSKFWSTPLGEATRAALNDAVQRIAAAVSKGVWEGQVAEVEGDVVYVNAGREAGLKVGDRLTVERPGKALTDPATGQVLASRKVALGTLSITGVEDKYATGSFTPAGSEQPKRGDFVVFAK
jgi:curli biogenesis system outer membrane secretion channel CsgG